MPVPEGDVDAVPDAEGDADVVGVADADELTVPVPLTVGVGVPLPVPDGEGDVVPDGVGEPDVVAVTDAVALVVPEPEGDGVALPLPVAEPDVVGDAVAEPEKVGMGHVRLDVMLASAATLAAFTDDSAVPAASVKAMVTRALTAVQSMSDSPIVDSATRPTGTGAPRSKSSRTASDAAGAPAGGATPRGGRTKQPPVLANAPYAEQPDRSIDPPDATTSATAKVVHAPPAREKAAVTVAAESTRSTELAA